MEARRMGGGVLAIVVAILGVLLERTMPASLSAAQLMFAWIALAVGGAVGLCLALWPTKPKAATHMGDSYNNSGNNFGHMGPVNVGRQDLHSLSPETIAEIVRVVPHGPPVVVWAVGSRYAFPMQAELAGALRAAGHQVREDSAMMYAGIEDQITVRGDAKKTEIFLKPRA